MKASYFIPVLPLTDGAPSPNQRRWADKERVQYRISARFIITWIGILVLQGAHFGSEKRTAQKMWQKASYGLSPQYICHSMTHDAYEFLQCSIHFADNSLQQPEGTEGYDPLF
jgi:hypothetical protein